MSNWSSDVLFRSACKAASGSAVAPAETVATLSATRVFLSMLLASKRVRSVGAPHEEKRLHRRMRSPAAAKVEAPTMMQRVDHSRITLLRLASNSCETPVNASIVRQEAPHMLRPFSPRFEIGRAAWRERVCHDV